MLHGDDRAVVCIHEDLGDGGLARLDVKGPDQFSVLFLELGAFDGSGRLGECDLLGLGAGELRCFGFGDGDVARAMTSVQPRIFFIGDSMQIGAERGINAIVYLRVTFRALPYPR